MKRSVRFIFCLTALLGPLRAQTPGDKPGSEPAAQTAEDMETLRVLLGKWVETRKLISKEKKDWELSRMIMTDQADLLREEIRMLGEKTESTRGEVAGSGDKLEELEGKERVITASMAGLESRVRPLELRVLALVESMPRPLAEKVKPLVSRIPPPGREGGEIQISLGERFQNAIGILNEMNKFSREIHEHNETRKLADGTNANVGVLYLGVAGAFYVNPVSGVAGVGRPKTDGSGWEWEEQNDRVEYFDRMMKMYRNELPAGYVGLPFEQRDVTPALPAEKETTP
jgi:hypothetical protein